MPLFFFDFYNGDCQTIDPSGLSFSSRTEACVAAAEAMPGIIRDLLAQNWTQAVTHAARCDTTVKIRNAAGRCVFKATLAYQTEQPD